MRSIFFRSQLLWVFPLLFVGCAALEVEEMQRCSPIKGTPKDWTTPGNCQVCGEAAVGWVKDFDNPVLVQLAHEAVGNNFTVASALQRVFQAEERARISRSALFPQIDTDLDSTRRQTTTGRSTQHNFALNSAWEIDLWGRLKDLKKADLATMDSQFQAYQAVRLSLVASVLKAAFELIESEEQIKSLQKNLRSLQANLDILDAKLEAGDANETTALEIALSRTDIARSRSLIFAEEQDRDEARRALEVLLGRYPKGVISALKTLPDPSRCIPIGLPSDLLIRRPDIIQAEMNVNQTLYNVSATQKQLLPSFRLTSGIGTSTSDTFQELFNLNNLVWNVGQGLTQPIFQGGRIRAEIKLSEYQRDELIATYANTVLTAFQEVEVALAAEGYLNNQVKALQDNVREARLAEELSLSDYEKGIVDIITLLQSQRRAFDAESGLLSARLLRLFNRVDLYLALGGDFDCKPIPMAPPEPEETIIKRYKSEKRPGRF
ncbi:MAG: TolC family protein [Verrucomicrobiales bacterium]|nr:TolC family protein [Verrucomicrobiales bacterium]